MSEQMLAVHFADWAVNLTSKNVPDSARHCARRAMLDTIGVIASGSVHPKVKALAGSLINEPGKCNAATGQKCDPVSAATINGMAGHVWDYDDNSYTGMIHGSVIILPAVLAVAQEIGATEEQALLAFIAGSEVTYCLGEICTHKHFMAGWWATGSCGLIGAVAAVCRLYGLNDEQTANAIGTAAVTAGIERAIAGTDTKPYLCGHVAAKSIILARAARAGITGPHDAFEKNNGFFALLNGGYYSRDPVETLGLRWRLEEPGLLFKTSPVCSAAHAVIEVTAQLLKEAGKTANDITSAVAEVPELVKASLVFGKPENAQQAQFSLPYCFACSAIHGSVRLDDLQPGEMASPEKHALMDKIVMRVADDLSSSPLSETAPESTRLTITFGDGQKISGFCGEAFGMPNRPLTDNDLINKFNSCIEFAGNVCPLEEMSKLEIIKLSHQAFGQDLD